MSSSSSARAAIRDRAATRGFRAVNWPLRDEPVRSLMILGACVAVGGVCGLVSSSALMGTLAAATLVAAMWKLWIPVTTEFDPRGIVLTALGRRRRIAWRDIDHLELHQGGLFLCTQPLPPQQSVWGSVFLPWGTDRELITTFCEEYHGMGVADWSGASRTPR